MITDEHAPHVRNLYRFKSVSQFKGELDWLVKRFRPLSLQEFLAKQRAEGRFSGPCFMLTFDDGFREMYEVVLPILQNKGIPAVFFLNSGMLDNHELCFQQKKSLLIEELLLRKGERKRSHRGKGTAMIIEPPISSLNLLGIISGVLNDVGIRGVDVVGQILEVDYPRRHVLDYLGELCEVDFADILHKQRPYLTSDEVRALMRCGHAIGSHSIDHPRFADISLNEQLRQTRESVKFLDERFGLQDRVFAFPQTDAGVARQFFESVLGDGTVEATFGTSAPLLSDMPMRFQRFSMERTNMSAAAVLSHQCLRAFKQRLTGRTTIHRPD